MGVLKMEIFNNKEELQGTKIKQNLFFYQVLDKSEYRGYNKSIKVYVLRSDYFPILVGTGHVNTASFRGERPTACKIISKAFNKIMLDGYSLKSKNIKIFEIQ